MKIYVDLILFLNFAIDFILLLSVSIILKRTVKINNIILGAFIGSLSTLFLFFEINSIELFLYKIIISILMCIISFSYKNIVYTFKNFIFLYMAGIVLGGFLYYLNNQFSYKNIGMIFYHSGISINYIFILIAIPIVIYIYNKQLLTLKNNYSKYYKLEIHLNNQVIKTTAFLDSGNKLVDPITKKPVILINENKLKKLNIDKYFYVPYHTIDNQSIIKCFKPEFVVIKDTGCTSNLLVGIIDIDIKLDGVDCILNELILEG